MKQGGEFCLHRKETINGQTAGQGDEELGLCRQNLDWYLALPLTIHVIWGKLLNLCPHFLAGIIGLLV